MTYLLRNSSLGLNSCVAYRLDNFVIGLTNADPATTTPVYNSSYTVCGQYSGSVAAGDNATVVCSPAYQYFRFVIVQGSHSDTQAICLTEVTVYERSKEIVFRIRKIRHFNPSILIWHLSSRRSETARRLPY